MKNLGGWKMPKHPLKLVNITIKLSRQLLEEFDEWWKREGFVSRTEAIRQAMREIMNTTAFIGNSISIQEAAQEVTHEC
ncbi:MAG: hypothetical protein DRJ30_07000 [Candidatus Methanomethylicota archaeon]|nr:MAG: hypothetical protein DRJ30_07000 [Candidatus Verstraetearchaeota archaeon]